MYKIPADIQSFYLRELQDRVAVNLHQKYWKWFRFFLDFCEKYNFPDYDTVSISHFQQKLASKGQTPVQLEEALQAVKLFQRYYKLNKKFTVSWESALQELNTVLISRNYSKNTVRVYTRFVRWFMEYSSVNISDISEVNVRQFLNFMAIEKRVSASAQKSAFFSLLFFFKNVLKRDFGDHSHNIRSPKNKKLPVVLSVKEFNRFFELINPNFNLIARLQYGCGLRVSELFDLRLKDLDFENSIVSIWMSKGQKNRIVPMPRTIMDELKQQVENVINTHNLNCKNNRYMGSFLPNNEVSNKAKEIGWQWLFPAPSLVNKECELWQYHIHQSIYTKKIAETRRISGSTKLVTSHTFRHSYATHLLLYGLDIRSVQELLGHSKVETTMLYLQLVRSFAPKATISPLDIDW